MKKEKNKVSKIFIISIIAIVAVVFLANNFNSLTGQAISGQCGAAVDGVYYLPPSDKVCASGISSTPPIEVSGKWKWDCSGVTCSSAKDIDGIGECGSANKQNLTSKPVGLQLCNKGNSAPIPIEFSDDNRWHWMCEGTGGTRTCWAVKLTIPSCTIGNSCTTSQSCPGSYNSNCNCIDVPNDGCPATTTPQCTDSDGGNKITIYGIAKGTNGVEEDRCGELLMTSGGVAYTSYCSGENCGVIEAICNPSGTSTTMPFQQCPNRCKDGACVKSSTTTTCPNSCRTSCLPNENQLTQYTCQSGICCSPSTTTTLKCTDSDGGKNYYVKGSTYGMYGGQMGTFPDACCSGDRCDYTTGDRVLETYCDGQYIRTEPYKCPNGCKDGACVSETLPTPTKEVTYQGVLNMLNKKCTTLETGSEGIGIGVSCDKICLGQGKTCVLTSLSRSDGDDILGGDCGTIWTTGLTITDAYLDCVCCSLP